MRARYNSITLGLVSSVLGLAQLLLAGERTSVSSGPLAAKAVLAIEVTDQPTVVFDWWDLWGEAEARIATIQERHIGYIDLKHSQMNAEYQIPLDGAPKRYFKKQTITNSWAADYFHYTAQTNQGSMSLTAQVNAVGETETVQGQMGDVYTNRWMDVQGHNMYGPFGPEYIERWTKSGTPRRNFAPHWPVFDGTTTYNDGRPGSADSTYPFADLRPAFFWEMDRVSWAFWGGDFLGHSGNPLNPGSPFSSQPYEWTLTRASWNSIGAGAIGAVASAQFSYSLELSEEDTLADVQARLDADRLAAAFENIPWGTERRISFGGHKTEDHSAFDGSSVWIYNYHSAFASTGYVYEQAAQVRFVTPAELRIPGVAYRARLIQYFYADQDPTSTAQVKKIFELELKEGQWESVPITAIIPAEDGLTVLEYFSMTAEPINPHPILPQPPSANPSADTAPLEYAATRPTITRQDIAGGNGSRFILSGSTTLQQIHLSDSWGTASNWPDATATWSLVPGSTAQVRLWRWTDDGSALGVWSLVNPTDNLARYYDSSTDFFFAEALGFGRATLRITINVNGQEVRDDIDIRTATAALAVDANRDGTIKFASEDASDATSAAQPYRFWLNDDFDGNSLNGESEVIGGTGKDYESRGDFGIASKRDLEDFARLRISVQGITAALKSGDLQLGFKWTDGYAGTPKINLYLHYEADGGTKYLTDTPTAIGQASNPWSATLVSTTNKNVVTPGDVFVLKKEVFTSLTEEQPTAYFLFEGAGEGKGQLQMVILDQTGALIGEGPGVWLDLKSIQSMYQRVKVTPRDPGGIPKPYRESTTFDASTTGTEPFDNGYPLQAAPDEAKRALVFVHGSNISYETAKLDAETMFKRLWWQGYGGRFVLFYWDTLVGPFDGAVPAHYNLNEYRAQKYGLALKNYVEGALPSDYAHNVVGHSLGNGVIFSALRARIGANGSVIPGMRARNVIFMQAAMPASCVDPNATTLPALVDLETPQSTPDSSGQLGYRGVIGTGTNATLFNIYNENDYALGWWVTNQRLMKPENLESPIPRANRAYTWSPSDGGKLFDTIVTSTHGYTFLRPVVDFDESMAFVARSRTTALGRMSVAGGITNNLNVGQDTEFNFGDQRADHSGEFTRPIQLLDSFYRYIFIRVR